MSVFLKIILAIGVISSPIFLNAQQDTIPVKRGRPLDDLLDRTPVQEDSTKLLFYSLDNIYSRDSFLFKGLDRHFHQYDPARNRDFDYGHLGNMGSASYQMLQEITPNQQFRLGYDQYDLYHKTSKDIVHYEQNRPFSELYFSGGETQSDLRVGALFSRSFTNNVNLVIDYDRIAQQGIYSHQANIQTAFLASLAYRGEKRLSTFLTYIINSSVEENNGGITDLSSLDNPVNDLRQNVNVFSEDASSRLQNQTIEINGYYRLGKDSIKSNFINSVHYQFQSFNEFYRYSDPSTSADSSFYKTFWISERGLRNYNEHSRIRNGIYLNSKFKDYYNFETGVRYDFNSINISDDAPSFNEVYLTFKGGIQLKERLALSVDFFYGLLDVGNEFGLDAKAKLALTKKQGFNFGFGAGRYGVNYVKEVANLNQEPFYQYDYAPIILQTLKAEYYNNTLNLKVGGKIQNSFNYVYFDISSFPSQDQGLYSITQLYTVFDIKWKRLLIENAAYIQTQNKVHLNIPSLFTKNSISYYGLIFKEKMLLKAGLDFRYIVNDRLPFYNPVIGQFYLNDSISYQSYPMLDARISFKVSSFTTFFKYENVSSFLIPGIEMQVQNYPQFDGRFRFGIQWNLWN